MFHSELHLPQILYLVAVAAYLGMFVLFLRLLVWKRYADRNYWRRRPNLSLPLLTERARQAGRDLPFFSVLVPARNESDVIECTVDHLARLDYPVDRYEVMVITDAKEARTADQLRPQTVQTAAGFLSAAMDGGGTAASPLAPVAEGLVLGLLARLAMEGGHEIRRRYAAPTKPGALQELAPAAARYLVWEGARRLWQARGKPDRAALERMLRRRVPTAGLPELEAAYAALLSHAIPAVAALACLRADPDRRRLLGRLVSHAAQAQSSLTREILYGMSEALATDVLQRLRNLYQAGDLQTALEQTYREVYPTTQDILAAKIREFTGRTDRPRLVHVDVPYDFDGHYGGRCLGYEVPSTKGRALNRGLSQINPATEWCGFYDAESRPDPRVLQYVAWRWLEDTTGTAAWRPPRVVGPARIFQGPVFQVRNFYEMGPFCKIASLYQAVAHDWYLPALFKRLPFVGGTNLFVEAGLLRQIGGYDHNSLTEDLELGTRAFLEANAWPEYLPYPSSEQTPPTFSGFYRQRLRWATGHLQVCEKVRVGAGATAPQDKRRQLLRQLWVKGQGEWLFYQAATLIPPVALTLHYTGLLDPEVIPVQYRLGLNVLSVIYLVFTLYAFYRYSGHLDTSGRPFGVLRGTALAVVPLLLLPLAAFLFPVPYSSALVLRTLGRAPTGWVKTPRTRE